MNNIIHRIQHTARAATVLLLALLTAQTAGAQMTVDVSNADDLANAFGTGGVSEINVTNNITGVGYLSLGRALTINLNGHTISGDELHFNVGPDGSLTINGGGQDGSVGNIISGYADGPAIYNNGTVTLSHVNIISSNANVPAIDNYGTVTLSHVNIISSNANVPAIDNYGTVTLSNVNITTNYDCAIGGYGTLIIGNNVSFNGWTERPFSTLSVNITGNYNYDPANYNPLANVVATVTVGGKAHYFENSDIALAYIVSHPDNDHFSLSGDTYTIHTATGWDAFCSLLADNDKGFFDGKTVQLGTDIGTADDPVTRMAGTAYHDFTGTFDGDGHTLTVGYGTADAPFGEQYAAPFRNLEDGCTIKNLHVAGHIYTSAKFAGGLAGEQYGDVTIQNCRSSVTIVSSVENTNNDGTHGGFIAYFGGKQKHLSFKGCVFDGKLLTTNGISHCGGFVGWANGVSGTTDTEVTFTNCLYAPAAIAPADGEDEVGTSESATFARKNNNTNTVTLTITNSYYTRTLGDAQGKALHSVTAGDGVTLALSGTATEYTVSGITAYEGNQGIKYGTTYYAGSGDAVRLTLSNTATGDVPEGYKYGYTASAGTLIGSTLTMPAEDVTVSPALRSTHAAVPVTYVDADGNTQTAQAIALDGTETSLGSKGKETWYFVGLPTVAFDHALNLNGNVHLILADGCTMNVTSNVNGIAVNGSLTIYGQTDGTGTLNATGNFNGIYNHSGDITISGGRVTASGGGAGIYTDSGTITISGGRVTATSDNEGIHTESGNITLGCTTASDFIYASSYFVFSEEGSLNIAGQRLYDEDGNYYSGTIIDYADLNGKTLRLSPGIALTARQAPDGNYWTTYYNSTLGFTIDEDENACAYTAKYGGDKLTLHKLGKEIPKGTAVIIVADNNVVSMTAATDLYDFSGANDLHGVDVDTDVDDITSALGTGTFYVLGMTTVGDEKHFGFHRYTGSEMAAHKAFILVDNSQAPARSLTMVFDEASGIESLTPDAAPKPQAADHWFTLDGRRLQAKPTAPGIYINNGKKVVIK